VSIIPHAFYRYAHLLYKLAAISGACHQRRTQDTMEGVHVVGEGRTAPEGLVKESPSSPVGDMLTKPQKLKQNVKLISIYEYRSRAWTVYFANSQTHSKKSEDSMGDLNPPPFS